MNQVKEFLSVIQAAGVTSVSQVRAMIIASEGDVPQGRISPHRSRAGATGMRDSLKKRGLLKSVHCELDRRLVMTRTTPKGLALLDSALDAAKGVRK